jgi:hypothetical protein
MAGRLRNNQLTLSSSTLSNPNGQAPMFAARAFSNSNSATIRRDSNISSIQNFTTGGYKFNFSQAMPNNNYATGTTGGTSGSYAAVTWGNRSRTYDSAEVVIDVSDPLRDRGIAPDDLSFIVWGN